MYEIYICMKCLSVTIIKTVQLYGQTKYILNEHDCFMYQENVILAIHK